MVHRPSSMVWSIIPPMPIDPYAMLQVARNAEPEVIAAAYRALARKYHPDKGGSGAATRRMQKINQAYGILKDPVKRKAYDRKHPYPGGHIVWRDEEAIDWWGTADEEDEIGWSDSYAQRMKHPVPIRRPGFLRRNWGCVVYAGVMLFLVIQ
ncbi:MAG: J domain-containing protein, partial [Anaerolineales bacterium]